MIAFKSAPVCEWLVGLSEYR